MNRIYAAALFLLALCPAAGAGKEQVLCYEPSDQGFIWHWLVSFKHPFPYSYVGATMEYDALAALGGERKARPREGMPAGKGTNWQAYHHELGSGWTGAVMDFPAASMFMTYAATYLVCDREYRDLSLRTGSDDALLVLLNGETAQKVQIQRGYNVEQDRADGLSLKKGWNTLLCKVDDYMGGHGLCVCLKTADGKPFTDYRIALVPEPEKGTRVEFADGKKYEAEATQLIKEAVTLKTARNDPSAALAAARDLTEKYPASKAAAESLFMTGSILREQGKTDEALAVYDAVLANYPFSKWAEDSLLAKAEIAAAANRMGEAVSAFEELLVRYGTSALVPEVMLVLAAAKAREGKIAESDSILEDLRTRFPQTLESVKALDGLADNKAEGGERDAAKKLWRQVIEEAESLSGGKYVWYVNVQAALKEIADGARTKGQAAK